jgi:hypothetical protein
VRYAIPSSRRVWDAPVAACVSFGALEHPDNRAAAKPAAISIFALPFIAMLNSLYSATDNKTQGFE